MKISNLILAGTFGLFALASCSDDDENTGGDDPNFTSVNLYATSNTSGDVTRYNLVDGSQATYTTLATDSEGIYYDPTTDSFTQAERSAVLNTSLATFINVNALPLTGVTGVTAAFNSSADLQSPRDLAVSNELYVVADNADVDGNPETADGRLFVYIRENGNFTLRNTITVDFKVWGIDFVGNDLYVVVDATNKLAIFNNFRANSTTGAVAATKTITIEGLTRTHGIDADGTTLILTDIGAATGEGSDTDGAFHVVTNFESKIAAIADGGTLSVSDQIRIAGASTLLGNPISASYDQESDVAYIAERANGGGRILAFASVSQSSGLNTAPSINNTLAGASSVYFYKN